MKSRPSNAPAYPIQRTPVRKISRSSAVLRTAAISLALVALIFGGLTLQMASGRDPALGASTATSSASASSSSSSSDAASTTPSVTAAPSAPQATVVQQAPTPAPVQTSTS